MKILVHEKLNDEFLKMCDKLGIVVNSVDENTHILITHPRYEMHRGVGRDKARFAKVDWFPELKEYVESDDESLRDFITFGVHIAMSGTFEPVPHGRPYNFESNGKIRLYNNPVLTTHNFINSGQIDSSGLWEFYDTMLKYSTVSGEKEKEEKPEAVPGI